MALTTPTGQPTPLQPGEFVNVSRSSEVTWREKNLSPSDFLYVRAEEFLFWNVTSTNAATVQWNLSYRLLLANGQVQVGFIPLPVANDGLNHTGSVQLAEGFLLGVSIGINNSGTPVNYGGQTFASVFLSRAQPPSNLNSVTLCQGYISLGQTLSWPGGLQVQPGGGPGNPFTATVANPAAGLDWVYTVPTQRRHRFQSLQATFTASAAVANRQIQLQVTDGTNTLWDTSAPVNVTAGQVITMAATTTNGGTQIIATVFNMVLPPALVIRDGFTVQTSTVAIQGGDQWSAIHLLFEDWAMP